jgi:hypothetical protein
MHPVATSLEQQLIEFIGELSHGFNRVGADTLYNLILKADPAVLKKVFVGQRRQWLQQVLNNDLGDLTIEDYGRGEVNTGAKVALEQIVSMIDQVNLANKGTIDIDLNKIMVQVGDHGDVLADILIDGQTIVQYLHATAGTEECNNVLATIVRPRLKAVVEGKPFVLVVLEKLRKAGVNVKM